MLIEMQMSICDKNIGSILNIYENSFVVKCNSDYCTVNSSLRTPNIPVFHVY